jgi:hypothetical protein
MSPNEYLQNPTVPKGFYTVQCTNVEVIAGVYLPTIIVELQIVRCGRYGVAAGAVLHVTIRGTHKAEAMHQKFRETFLVAGDPTEAVGRFGCVLIDVSQFQGRRYSAVHFIRQSDIARHEAKKLEYADENGEIP